MGRGARPRNSAARDPGRPGRARFEDADGDHDRDGDEDHDHDHDPAERRRGAAATPAPRRRARAARKPTPFRQHLAAQRRRAPDADDEEGPALRGMRSMRVAGEDDDEWRDDNGFEPAPRLVGTVHRKTGERVYGRSMRSTSVHFNASLQIASFFKTASSRDIHHEASKQLPPAQSPALASLVAEFKRIDDALLPFSSDLEDDNLTASEDDDGSGSSADAGPVHAAQEDARDDADKDRLPYELDERRKSHAVPHAVPRVNDRSNDEAAFAQPSDDEGLDQGKGRADLAQDAAAPGKDDLSPSSDGAHGPHSGLKDNGSAVDDEVTLASSDDESEIELARDSAPEAEAEARPTHEVLSLAHGTRIAEQDSKASESAAYADEAEDEEDFFGAIESDDDDARGIPQSEASSPPRPSSDEIHPKGPKEELEIALDDIDSDDELTNRPRPRSRLSHVSPSVVFKTPTTEARKLPAGVKIAAPRYWEDGLHFLAAKPGLSTTRCKRTASNSTTGEGKRQRRVAARPACSLQQLRVKALPRR